MAEGGLTDEGEHFLGIKDQALLMNGWLMRSEVLAIRFEDLVGPLGGGDETTQRGVLEALAQHIGLQMSTSELAAVSEGMYGMGRTFRKGVVGQWRGHFDSTTWGTVFGGVGEAAELLGYDRDR